jgi:enoyl-CoA hydratase/carnithine racemase
MLQCDVPIVARIEGACLGAGLEMASCCDVRIAGESAKFGAPIAKLGFPMALREAAVVARAVGDATARELLLEAAVLAAAEMKSRGFLQRVVPDAQVAARAEESAQRIAALAPQAARLNKQSLRALGPAVSQLDAAGSYAWADSDEHREGIAAFLDKRKPRF